MGCYRINVTIVMPFLNKLPCVPPIIEEELGLVNLE